MSGSKRKSQYRKSVTTNYLHTNITLDEGDDIAKIICSRGANLFEIEVSKEEKNGLGLLPNKFRNLIWIKRNDFVIVTITSETDQSEHTEQNAEQSIDDSRTESKTEGKIEGKIDGKTEGKIEGKIEQSSLKRFEIKEILNAEHIKSLKLTNNWPVTFEKSTFGTGVKVAERLPDIDNNPYGGEGYGGEDMGESEGEDDEEDEVRTDRFGNTIDDDEEEEGEEEEEEEVAITAAVKDIKIDTELS